MMSAPDRSKYPELVDGKPVKHYPIRNGKIGIKRC